MKLLPILGYNQSTQNFKGQIIKDSSSGHYKLNELLKSNPNNEKTSNTTNSYKTLSIYMASPLENNISPALKEKVDYIFYDIEPKFPDINKEISKIYFFPATANQKTGYLEQLESVKGYFERLIKNDSKTVGEYEQKAWNEIDMPQSRYKADYFKAHVRDAQHNKETIENCEKLIKTTMPLINKKDAIYQEIQNVEAHKKLREKDNQLIGLEIDNRNQLDNILKSKIKTLETKKASYELINKADEKDKAINTAGKQLSERGYVYGNSRIGKSSIVDFFRSPQIEQAYIDINGALKTDEENNIKEQKNIQNKISQLNKRIEEYSCEIKKNEIYIAKLKEYQKCLPEMIEILSQKINNLTKHFEKSKADLIPHFDKLKNYFNARGGIRVIK